MRKIVWWQIHALNCSVNLVTIIDSGSCCEEVVASMTLNTFFWIHSTPKTVNAQYLQILDFSNALYTLNANIYFPQLNPQTCPIQQS